MTDDCSYPISIVRCLIHSSSSLIPKSEWLKPSIEQCLKYRAICEELQTTLEKNYNKDEEFINNFSTNLIHKNLFDESPIDLSQYTSHDVFVKIDDPTDDILTLDENMMNAYNRFYNTFRTGEYTNTGIVLKRWEMCNELPPHYTFYNRLLQDISLDTIQPSYNEHYMKYPITKLMFHPEVETNILDRMRNLCQYNPINSADTQRGKYFYFNTPYILHFQRLPTQYDTFTELSHTDQLRLHNQLRGAYVCQYIENELGWRWNGESFAIYKSFQHYLKTKEKGILQRACSTIYRNKYTPCGGYIPCEHDIDIIRYADSEEGNEDFDLLIHPAYIRLIRKKWKEDDDNGICC